MMATARTPRGAAAAPAAPLATAAATALLLLACCLGVPRGASALDAATALLESARFGGPATLEALCSALGERMSLPSGTVHPSRADPWPRVYDAFPVHDDLDALEIRLYELHTIVDYFVIAESNTTFTNRPKRIMYRDVRERFRRFWPQIIYVPVDTFSSQNGSTPGGGDHWQREAAVRRALFQAGLRGGGGDAGRAARDGDVVVFGDVDELPRPWVVQALRVCEGYNPGKVRLQMRFTYYAYNILHSSAPGGTWAMALATRFNASLDYSQAEQLRGFEGFGGTTGTVAGAGWHCSFCFRTFQQFLSKIGGFSHVEYGANPRFYTREHVVWTVRTAHDIFDRPDQNYTVVDVGPEDAPTEVLMHKGRYAYLLDRRGPNAALEGLDD